MIEELFNTDDTSYHKGKINKNLIEANTRLLDENKWLKEDNLRLNNIINELENYFNKIKDTRTLEERMIAKYTLKYIKELKGSDKE